MGAVIEGILTDAETGTPVSDAFVEAYTGGTVVFPAKSSNITGVDGRYRIEGLSEGVYGLKALGPIMTSQGLQYAATFLGGVTHPAQADALTVATDRTYTADMRIKRGTSFEGKVTRAISGEPVEGAVVTPSIVAEDGTKYSLSQYRGHKQC